jgi:hypothetical protein
LPRIPSALSAIQSLRVRGSVAPATRAIPNASAPDTAKRTTKNHSGDV